MEALRESSGLTSGHSLASVSLNSAWQKWHLWRPYPAVNITGSLNLRRQANSSFFPMSLGGCPLCHGKLAMHLAHS